MKSPFLFLFILFYTEREVCDGLAERERTKAKRERAFELYCILDNYEKTAEALGVALSTVKKWGVSDRWQEKKVEQEKAETERMKCQRIAAEKNRLKIKSLISEKFMQKLEAGEVDVDFRMYCAVMKDTVDFALLGLDNETTAAEEKEQIEVVFSVFGGPNEETGEPSLIFTNKRKANDSAETQRTLDQVAASFKALSEDEELECVEMVG